MRIHGQGKGQGFEARVWGTGDGQKPPLRGVLETKGSGHGGREYPTKKSLALFPAEEQEFFILSGTLLVQLGEERNTWFNIVIEIEEVKSYQNPLTIGMQLGNCKLMKIEASMKNGSIEN